MPTTYAVIGASRGIGLEYVRQLASRADTHVYAVVRSKGNSPHLQSLVASVKNVHVVEGDVVDHASLERAAKEIRELTGGSLDYLIHNAARMSAALFFLGFDDYASTAQLDADMIDAFKVNALGVVHGIQAFLPLLRAGATKKIVVIGTVGALYDLMRRANVSYSVAYGASKAAATMITTKYALQLAPEGFTVITLTPGIVDTQATQVDQADPAILKRVMDNFAKMKDRGLPDIKRESVEESVGLQLKRIDALSAADNGKILGHHGEEYAD